MSDAPYEVARLDELECLSVDDEGLTWRPVRRHFGIRAFGVNAYTAEEAGARVVEEHRDGAEELYYVVSGRARFLLGEDELEVEAGTFVFVRPDVVSGAVASVGGTTVLAMGARAGEVFEPSGWEESFAAHGYLRAGEEERGRKLLTDFATAHADDWIVHYKLGVFESVAGRQEAALEHLVRAIALEPQAAEHAAADSDLAALRDQPGFASAIAGQTHAGGASA